MTMIFDATGKGYGAKVDDENRLLVKSVSQPQVIHSNEEGEAYNINTGVVTLSASTAILYIKNNEDRPLIVTDIVVGLGQAAGGVTDIGEVTVYRNPTAGTIISGATDVAINENRNFGSNRELDALAYVGTSGATATGGAAAVLLFTNVNGRLFATLNLDLPKGSSLAIQVNPKLSSGSVIAYAAAICYLGGS